MLEELHIRNFAIIDTLHLNFGTGFHVITGETGAGKSILIDAVELLLGSKPDNETVRAGAEKAIIEGTFALDAHSNARVLPLLHQEDLLDPDNPDESSVILTREIRRNGRSTARINGVVVRADLLREVGGYLVDIHGQSAHLSLFKPRAHMDLLDRYCNLLEVRDALATVVTTLNQIRAEVHSLREDKEALMQRADRLRYEIEEINAAALQPDEEADLIAERNRLANSEQLASLTGEVVTLLNGDDNDETLPALDALQQVASLLSRLATIDPDLEEDYNLAEQLSAGAQELALSMGGYIDEIEYDPDRLNELEERLEVIKTLKRRYRTDSIEGILAYAERASSDLQNIEHSDERLEELQREEERTLRHIGDLCQRISRTRELAGRSLGNRVVQELNDLRMENARFEVSLIQEEDPQNGCYVRDKRYAFNSTGMDQVEFVMSANPGEPLRPLAKVASGGEAARIMLALKRVLTHQDETPLLIFDEIDQGIGGRIGAIVGEKLWSLSDSHQVMVVTHLPQIAGFGDIHYRVTKQIKGKRTLTQVTPLEGDDMRVDELAAMLGATGESGMQSARDLLADSRQRKEAIRPTQPVQEDLL